MYFSDGRHKSMYDFETEVEAITLDFLPTQSILARNTLHISLLKLIDASVTDIDINDYYACCGSYNSSEALMLIFVLRLLRVSINRPEPKGNITGILSKES